MNKKDQRRILREMCRNHRIMLLEDLAKVPDHWDGIELRQWFADRAREHFGVIKHARLQRALSYDNDRLIRNI